MTTELNKVGKEVTKVKKPLYKKWWAWVIAVVILVAILSPSEEDTVKVLEKADDTMAEAQEDLIEEIAPEVEEEVAEVTPVEEVKEEEPVSEEPKLSLSQENAIQKANDYLGFTAFSNSGLIKQLEFDGFSNEDSTFAVNNVEVDWKEQAGKKAKEYLDFTSFSRSGLIEQLQFDGFTTEEATFGVDQVGL